METDRTWPGTVYEAMTSERSTRDGNIVIHDGHSCDPGPTTGGDELSETLAVLCDPRARADLAESAEAAERGDFTTEAEMQQILDARLDHRDDR